jgi:hypothetical protein
MIPMNRLPSLHHLAVHGLLIVVLALGGCVSTTVKKVNSVKVETAVAELPQEQLLEVAILPFDPGVPDTLKAQEKENISPAVREAESKYMAHVLRQTLQDSGYWGAARVVPAASPGADLTIKGKILASDGEIMKVAIEATDATGRKWLDKTYEETAAEYAYTEKLPAGSDPFQDLYSRVANDLLVERKALSAAKLKNINRVANLRFAADLAPARFGEYLKADGKGGYAVTRLPPEGDPFIARVDQIRARDELLIDTLDQHYGAFRQNVGKSYQEWRKSSYREAQAYRELRNQEITRKILGAAAVIGGIYAATTANNAGTSALGQVAVIGGIYGFKSGLDKGSEKKIHAEALKELTTSLGTEVQAQNVDLDGKTVKLSGSAEEQYGQWREQLRELYTIETGLPATPAAKPTKTGS